MRNDDPRFLPPMSMLRCFEASARLGGFSRAAEALGLTQSGVSRQIAHLESWLGMSLFDRQGRRVFLNETGRAYLDDVAPGLAAIRRATRSLVEPRGTVINLATLPSFGMRWLAPRLPRLTARHPDLVVNIVARSDIFDFAEENFDAAIHVGPAQWPGADHDLLFREVVVPVISPDLAAKHTIRSPADFLEVPLMAQSERLQDWRRWFGNNEVPFPDGIHIPHFSHFLMLAQAVAAGGGAALLPTFLIQPELADGSLIVPLDHPLADERVYYMVYPPQSAKRSAFARFRNWMAQETGTAQADLT